MIGFLLELLFKHINKGNVRPVRRNVRPIPKKKPERVPTEAEIEKREEEFYEAKSAWMETILGQEYEMVMHAIIPYEVGGPVDVYMYPNHVDGTVLATKEMVSHGGQECLPFDGQFYEVAMAVKSKIDAAEDSEFSRSMVRCRKIMTMASRYSGSATLKSGDTVEVPMGDGEDNACALFWEVDKGKRTHICGRPMTVQYIIEVLRDEMEYAQRHGSENLITLLKQQGIFPSSDLNRKSCLATN